MISTTETDYMSLGHLIGGRDSSAGQFQDVIDPARTSDVVARVAIGGAGDVDRAVAEAHHAFLSWRHSTPQERTQSLLRGADVLADSAEELTSLLVREHGGLLSEARTDFALGVGVVQHTASLIEEFLEPTVIDDEQCTIRIEKMPRGVAAAIVPWNMPIVLAVMKLAPALATGNTIVIKPSPVAPAALAIAIGRIAKCFPPGVINIVHGDVEVGQALTSHPLVRKVGFTGGTMTARSVLAAGADTIKNVTLELGGNDPAIVLDDADLDATLDRMLPGIFTRSGQICFAIKRIYVPRAIHDRFVAELCARVENYIVGHGLSERVDLGALATQAQKSRVCNLISAERVAGAKVIRLGRLADDVDDNTGYFVLPHVVAGAKQGAAISSCEQFGPVIPVIAYSDEDEAIGWANDSEYGLGSSVWTADHDRGLTIASRIEAGSTFVNTHSMESIDLRMPFGGMKQSGIGRELGVFGMTEYVEDHAIRLLK